LFVGSIPALFASLTDITSPDKRASAMGRLSASLTAGFMIGPVLGGVLATAFTDEPSFVYPFVLTAGLYGALTLAALFALPESRGQTIRSKEAQPKQSFVQRVRVYCAPRMSVPLMGVATVHFSSSSTSAIIALWALDRFGWGITEISWVISTMAALVILWNLAAAPLTSRFGNTRVLLVSQAGVVLAFLSFVFVREPVAVYLILVLAAFGNGLGRTVTTAAVSIAAEADRRGEAMGVQGTVSSALTAGGPLLAGWLFVTISPSAPFAVIACFAAAAFTATAAYVLFGTRDAAT
jgi:MFS family permease